MPVVLSNPQFPNQVGSSPFNQPYGVQLNFGQMLREVTQWNPSCDTMMAGRFINEVYRQILDRRDWWGTKIRGQIGVPTPYSGGTCSVTNGSQTVTGNGTSFTTALVGQQFRLNFTYPYQTITAVNQTAQTLTLDMPWIGPSQSSAGFYILAVYFQLDVNIKRFKWATNQQMGWPMEVNVPRETLNEWDTWRTELGWSTHMATMPPSPQGGTQIELWPGPFTQQIFPFEAYTQPPDMQADTDAPVPFIRADAIVKAASVKALRFRPKQNTYYSEQGAITVAQTMADEFMAMLNDMELRDNDLDQQDVTWEYGGETGGNGSFGSAYAQNHDV